ncbi:MAG: hypothetical protein JO340_10715 [Acidobacteriaceae bacterium]|nr:hypothetical protein [Acidobacteriaceae bacterium]
MSPQDENLAALEGAFAALRKEYVEAPPRHLEALLRTRLRRRRYLRHALRWMLPAAAAAFVSLAFLPAPHNLGAPPFPKPPAAEPRREIPAPLERFAAPRTARPVLASARHARKPARQAPRSNWAEAGGFLAIPYAEPFAPAEQIDVYRVELPRTALAHYGLPLRAGNAEAPVPAEVAVGSDGVVRAIRFVP